MSEEPNKPGPGEPEEEQADSRTLPGNQLRASLLQRLGGEHYDILVIGGGIVGAGIARDAALRGYRTALVERRDYASGSSSKTSKLIHGGLRYLATGKFSLVRESLAERAILRSIAPRLVQPLEILLPAYAGDSHPAWAVSLALWIYDLLAKVPQAEAHAILDRAQALYRFSQLSAAGIKGVGIYRDCLMDDSRLVWANISQAMHFGAVCLNYAPVRSLISVKSHICGAVVEDIPTGKVFEVRATVVINATGAWADHMRRLSSHDAPPRLSPTKGIHVILPPFMDRGVFFQAHADKRMLFMLPWQGATLLGTTESIVNSSLDELEAEGREVDYLLSEVNRIIQERRFTRADVVATFAGARPLLNYEGSAHRASREHRIETDDKGMVSVMGGKYTTYRAMAQQAVDLVTRQHYLKGKVGVTDSVPLLDADATVIREQWSEAAERIGEECLARLVATYGVGASRVLERIREKPETAEPVVPGQPMLRAELAYMAEWEQCVTLSDLLTRRSHVAWLPGNGEAFLAEAAACIRQANGYSSDVMERQKKAFSQEVARSREALGS